MLCYWDPGIEHQYVMISDSYHALAVNMSLWCVLFAAQNLNMIFIELR